jgi:hypothetical protein
MLNEIIFCRTCFLWVFNDGISFHYSGEMKWLGAQGSALKFGGLKPEEISSKTENILSRVGGSVTNNNGFWIG